MGLFGLDGIELDEAPKDVMPLCPYCDAKLTRLWYKSEGLGGIGEKQIVLCPHCRKMLAYALWRS